ncbi:MAG: hypothetical protein HY958_07375 [Bacteroidia bacterium]|nr:hypothetical protein [Bacteroidia bacterium]
MKKKTVFCLIVAILLTAGGFVYQRMTGPTYQKDINFTFNEQNYSVVCPRSHSGTDDCVITIERKELTLSANLIYKKYPTDEAFDTITFNREGDILSAKLPVQPPAGKLQYYFHVFNREKSLNVTKDKPVIIRFKGDVPKYFLLPHIILMFMVMFLSNLSGLLAIVKNFRFRVFGIITFLSLLIGGMILGPVVQKYAFGALWTGVPFGWDLTDNKTLITFIFWFLAVIFNMRKERPFLVIIAAVITLVIFSIPHSLFGSELDYNTGNVTTGFVTSVSWWF